MRSVISSESWPLLRRRLELVVGRHKGPTSRLTTFPLYAFASTTKTPGRRDEDVVDVAARPRNQSVVQRDNSVANLAVDVAGQPALALASLAEAHLCIACGHLSRNLRGMVAVLTSHLINLALRTTDALRRGRGAWRARLHRAVREAGQAGHGLRRTVPDRLSPCRERDRAGRTRRRVAQPKFARRLAIDP